MLYTDLLGNFYSFLNWKERELFSHIYDRKGPLVMKKDIPFKITKKVMNSAMFPTLYSMNSA